MSYRLPLKNSSGKYLISNGKYLLFDFDKVVCKAVKNMDRPIASLVSLKSGEAIQVEFTPITDSAILKAVEEGKVKIRLQLLGHLASSRNGGKKGRNHSFLIPYDYNTSFTFNNIPDYGRSSYGNRKAFTRRRCFDKKTYTYTWVDLTPNELELGKAYLYSEDGTSWYRSYDWSTWDDRDEYHYVAVEIYVPALGKGTSNTWEYEQQGYFQVSNAVGVKLINFHK